MRNTCASDGLPSLTWNEIFSDDKNYEQSLQESLCKNYSDDITLYWYKIFTVCEALWGFCIVGGGIKVHLTLRPLNVLLCQPWVIMIMEKSVEWLAGETEVLGENLPQCRSVHHKSHMLSIREPGPLQALWGCILLFINSLCHYLRYVQYNQYNKFHRTAFSFNMPPILI
jgi:hypothetical protein